MMTNQVGRNLSIGLVILIHFRLLQIEKSPKIATGSSNSYGQKSIFRVLGSGPPSFGATWLNRGSNNLIQMGLETGLPLQNRLMTIFCANVLDLLHSYFVCCYVAGIRSDLYDAVCFNNVQLGDKKHTMRIVARHGDRSYSFMNTLIQNTLVIVAIGIILLTKTKHRRELNYRRRKFTILD
ncbi:hypothetical protein ACS0TY_028237 [Phlomoides rotata]